MKCRLILPVLFMLCAVNSDAVAQGLRVSQLVYDEGRLDSAGREPVVASSLTLFHAGRVYDYVEATGEVVIFEPVQKRFTVLNLERGVYTVILFNELNRLLNARGPKTEEYIQELKAQSSSDAERVARMLTFQLNPTFETNFEERIGLLTLSSESWKYAVSTREWEDIEQLERYLAYTDWMSRLNYILHPSAMFPEPRLALNQELRKLNNRIPVVVHLDLRPDQRLILRAEHQFVRNLTDADRALVNRWNEALKGTGLKEVPFRNYQQTVLASRSQ
ncbi:MAG: hypothetical protein R3C59_29045 [Planctomycetaceae bacterium]